MQYVSFYLLALFLLTSSSVSVAQTPANSEVAEVYPPEFVSDYSQECVQTSMAEGLEAAEAENLCDCTIQEFQRQYTLQEFKQLTADSVADKNAENELIEVGQVCFEQLLYEQ